MAELWAHSCVGGTGRLPADGKPQEGETRLKDHLVGLTLDLQHKHCSQLNMQAGGTQGCPGTLLCWSMSPIIPLICPSMPGCQHPGAWRGLAHVFMALALARGTAPNPSISWWHRDDGFF